MTYRSEVKIDFKGNYSSDLNPAFNNYGLPIPTATGGATQSGYLTLNLPEMWEVSGYNRVDPQWAIHYSGLHQLESVPAAESDLNEWRHAVPET